MMKLRDWSALPEVGFQIGAWFMIGPFFGQSKARFKNQSKLPLIKIFSKLDKNSKRNSIMVCRHWYDTVRGSIINL